MSTFDRSSFWPPKAPKVGPSWKISWFRTRMVRPLSPGNAAIPSGAPGTRSPSSMESWVSERTSQENPRGARRSPEESSSISPNPGARSDLNGSWSSDRSPTKPRAAAPEVQRNARLEGVTARGYRARAAFDAITIESAIFREAGEVADATGPGGRRPRGGREVVDHREAGAARGRVVPRLAVAGKIQKLVHLRLGRFVPLQQV